MRNLLLVARREFLQRVRSRGFVLTSIGVPVILAIVALVTGGVTTPQIEMADLAEGLGPQEPVGYVDQADLIASVPEGIRSDRLQEYPDEAAAGAALERGEIEAYYVIPADYPRSGELRRVSLRLPGGFPPDDRWLERLLARNLFPELDAEQVSRLEEPLGPGGLRFVRALAGEGEEATEEGGISFLPFLVVMAVMIPLFTGGSYLFQSLAQEKGSRMMEVLLVSLRPRQLLAGKLLGLGALTLVQYLIWAGIGGAALLATGQGVAGLLSGINLSAGELGPVLLFALGGYWLYASLMAGIGALASDVEGSRGWVFLITLPILVPIYLWSAIVGAPNEPLSVFLSFFPFSAPVTMLLRMTAAQVPIWQVGASAALLLATAAGLTWLMARLFRAQILLSGEKISLGRLARALTG